MFAVQATIVLGEIVIQAGAVIVGGLLLASVVSPSFLRVCTKLAEKIKDKDEPREPTPFTHPSLFEHVSSSLNPKKTKTVRNKKTHEHWCEDWLHYDHYEVYMSQKDLEKGKRNRVVSFDGRRIG